MCLSGTLMGKFVLCTTAVWQVAGVDNITAIKGACYIKYMAASAERSYCSGYSGQDRGILLQFGQQQVCPPSVLPCMKKFSCC